MSTSMLHRLASERLTFRRSELPPNWIFHPHNSKQPFTHELTWLGLLLAGPEGTPYAAGVWNMLLRFPADYPQSPPNVMFRTEIYHPNVDWLNGSLCVDTLKRAWEPKMAIRDILITVSGLLIQPNPDLALNEAAAKLLQEDYQAFCRQAKHMTSIHAICPKPFRSRVEEAKSRGQGKPKNEISSTNALSESNAGQLESTQESQTDNPQNSDSECDEASASKENDPSLSPTPVTAPSPSLRRPTLGKRPLSDLPTPIDTGADYDEETPAILSPSEQNIVNNTPPRLPSSSPLSSFSSLSSSPLSSSSPLLSGDPQQRSLSQKVDEESRVLKSTVSESVSDLAISTASSDHDQSESQSQSQSDHQPLSKRLRSSKAKEEIGATADPKSEKPANVALSKPTSTQVVAVKTTRSNSRKSIGLGSTASINKVNPRTGLRRL